MKKITLLFLILLFCIGKNHAQYYSSAFGLNGSPLKTALHNIIKNHNTQSWPLWAYFPNTDANANNNVWDIYSQVPGNSPPYLYTFGTDQCGAYSQEGDCYNHEHTWPSTFFNDATPMRTDLFHVYPTDGFVNNKRSNYPFGEVTAATWTSQSGSKLGNSNTYPGYTDKVFEPVDSFKGDMARTYFYMTTRYEGEDAGWGNWTMANGAQLTADAITLLMTWHHNDPVSQKELDRNNAIFLIQNNKNPFIDYPIFADCIWGTADCAGLGLEEDFLSKNIKIYPIPADKNLTIENNVNVSVHKISVLNMTGNLMLQNDFSNSQKQSVDISMLPPGNYLLLIHTSKGIFKKIFSKN